MSPFFDEHITTNRHLAQKFDSCSGHLKQVTHDTLEPVMLTNPHLRKS